jgi:hypothetical protein
MRWGRKEAHTQKDTRREESSFLNTRLKKDALREKKDPLQKRHSEGGKIFSNTLLKKDALWEESYFLNTLLKEKALREEKGPRPKGHSEGGK